MEIKVILYILITPVIIWAADSIDINKIFKKNRIYQATFLYVVFVLSLAYLTVNFLYDFFTYARFIWNEGGRCFQKILE